MPGQTEESLQSFFEFTDTPKAKEKAQQAANVGGGFGNNQGGLGNITLDQSPQAQELQSQGEELYGTSMQDVQDQIEAGEYKKKKNPAFQMLSDIGGALGTGINAGYDFFKDYTTMGGLGGVLMTPFKMLAEPTVETFQNPQALAQLALLFEKNKDNPNFKKQYLSDHGDLLKEAFGDDLNFDAGTSEYADKNPKSIEEIFDQKLNDALATAKTGKLGKYAQYSSDPTAFYDANPNLDQTTTQLMDLAKLDASKYPGLADKIFAARAELDRMGKNPFTGNPQQGGSGISSAYNQGGGDSGSGSGSDTTDTAQDFAMPDLGTADIVYPDAQETVDTYASNSPLQNLLTGALNAKDGGIINAADGTFIQISMEQKQKLPLTFNEIRKAKEDVNVQNKNMGGMMNQNEVDLAPNFDAGI